MNHDMWEWRYRREERYNLGIYNAMDMDIYSSTTTLTLYQSR